MYHKVGFVPRTEADRQLNVSVERFQLHIRLLKRLGFTGVTLSHGLELLDRRPQPLRRPVVISFDDGFNCVDSVASPLLLQAGWPATVFVSSSFIGRFGSWPGVQEWTPEPVMDAEQLRRLASLGWEIGGHTRSHADLSMLPRSASFEEISGGKQELEEILERPVRVFAYPYGKLTTETPELVKTAGFTAAVTVRSGNATSVTDRFLLPRVKVASRDSTVLFLYRLLFRRYFSSRRRTGM